jgi:signal transduction histidine kinase
VVRHADATEVSISVTRAREALVVAVRDNGRGIDATPDPDAKPQGRGFGLVDIAHRAEILGGTIEINSGRSLGTTIVLTLPAAGRGDAPPPGP